MQQETIQNGKYEILHEIGQGGMAVVYKGRDASLDREVAIKVLHPHLANRADSRMRLQREAKAVARLHHPNILEIYDYSGLDCEESYIVTEYVRGETLKDFTDRHTPSLPEVGAMVVHEITRALAHAHEAGIIHRDIKPENIMIRDDGVLKLMDFGIAQIVDMQAMTVTGALVGSPAHMSPEHVEGKPLDFRADVFSLGTLLYFLCAGRLPFDSPSPHALLRQILEATYEDPRLHNPAIGRRLKGIIARCLARDPDERYDSVEHLGDDLAAYLGELGFEDPAEELTAYFDQPPTAEAAMTRRTVDQLMALAERSASDGKVAAALECYNQVLSLQGDREDALAQVRRLSTARARNSRLRAAAIAALVMLTVGGLAVALGGSGDVRAPAPDLAEHVAALPRTPIAVAPALAPAPAALASEEAAPSPFTRLQHPHREAATRAARRAIATATEPLRPAVAARLPPRIRIEKPRKPRPEPTKPAAPKPVATAQGHNIRLKATHGAALIFEGKRYDTGDSGTLVRRAGSYTVTVEHDDPACEPRKYTFKLPSKKPTIHFQPGFKEALLQITGAPPNARVRAVGRTRTAARPFPVPMRSPRQRVHVTVTAPGHVETTKLIDVRAGQLERVPVRLAPE